MNKTASNNSFSPFESQEARASAAENASELLTDAAVCVDTLLKYDERMSTAPKQAALVAAHASLSLLDFEGGRIAKALEEIAESLDFLAARPDDASESPTEHERIVIYRALEADYMESGHPPTSIKEMDDALCRFKKLAGL